MKKLVLIFGILICAVFIWTDRTCRENRRYLENQANTWIEDIGYLPDSIASLYTYKIDIADRHQSLECQLLSFFPNWRVTQYLIKNSRSRGVKCLCPAHSFFSWSISGMSEKETLIDALEDWKLNPDLKFDNDRVVKLICKTDNYQETDRNLRTPLIIATRYELKEVVVELIKKGADVNLCDKSGQNALHYALKRREWPFHRNYFAEKAGDRNTTEVMLTKFTTRANLAAFDIAKMLIENGADVNLKDAKTQTPLMNAAYDQYSEIVALLIKKGADVNAVNNEGETALMFAAVVDNPDIVELLLNSGASIEVVSKNEETAFHCSLIKGNNMYKKAGERKTAKILIEKGADVNAKWKKIAPPILFFIQDDDYSMVELMISKGADLSFRNKNGDSLVDIASGDGHNEIVRLLLRAGAK
ncbi:MAG: ankyrin repeat domain-containing protein [Candidatus Wallbacteria bacterium]|nr:ankyrin repeat domain-containing protein [Candidatus Wallbacteria bacterium]